MSVDLILYGTVGCHLCEQAKAVIELARVSADQIDIIDGVGLLDRYGMRIPVLQRSDTGEELGWPFGVADVLRFLS
ncbi:MAG: glutaredoxin [Gallionellales bacterium RIFOXYB12_FULL_54_9]|nr:MAG: glutaredoxin [Gallionellales bacterium RIFOXYB12_FULL_54_9]